MTLLLLTSLLGAVYSPEPLDHQGTFPLASPPAGAPMQLVLAPDTSAPMGPALNPTNVDHGLRRRQDGTLVFLGEVILVPPGSIADSHGPSAQQLIERLLGGSPSPTIQLQQRHQSISHDTWTAVFDQVVDNLPVYGAYALASGTLSTQTAPGTVTYLTMHLSQASLPAAPWLLSGAEAVVSARSVIDREFQAGSIEGAPVLTALDVGNGDLRHCWKMETRTERPWGRWHLLLDAVTGQLLRTVKVSLHEVSGEVRFDVEPSCAGEIPRPVAMPHTQWTPGDFTSDAGLFHSTATPEQTEILLDSPYFALFNHAGANAGPWNVALAAAPAFNEIVISDAPLDQVDPFFHAHHVRSWMRSRIDLVNSQRQWSNFSLPIHVNRDDTCNAYYDGELNFFRSGGGCLNTGRVATIVYHEYAHGIHHRSLGPVLDVQTSEGSSDFVAATMNNDPQVRGLTSCQTAFRTCDNDFTYCDSGCTYGPASEVHLAGQVLCAAWWSLRQQLSERYGYDTGVSTTERIFLRYLELVGTMSSAYDATIAADDDDDGNPANGTTHSCQINKAFADDTPGAVTRFPQLAGIIPSTPSLALKHSPPGNLEGVDGEAVLTFDVDIDLGCAASSALDVALYVSKDGEPAERLPLSPRDGASSSAYEAAVTGLEAGTRVSYYAVATLDDIEVVYPKQSDNIPRNAKWPAYRQAFTYVDSNAPAHDVLYTNDFENTDGGLMPSDDSGGTGDWEWNVPGGVAGDPTTAHSGDRLWGTDLGSSGDGSYLRGENSWVELPPIDVSAHLNVRLQFWRQLLHSDIARVEVNGRPVFENRVGSFFWREPVWTFSDIDIADASAGQATISIRFLVSDLFDDGFQLGGWNLDDVRVTGQAIEAAWGVTETLHPGALTATGCGATRQEVMWPALLLLAGVLCRRQRGC